MTTLADRPNTALLVIDMQEQVVADVVDRDRVIGNIAALVARAREQGVPVVWVQHHDEQLPTDSAGWPSSRSSSGRTPRRSCTSPTATRSTAATWRPCCPRAAFGRVVVTGAQTDMCIRGTLHGALARGYDSTLVADSHTTEDLRPWGVPVSPEQVIAHTTPTGPG